MKTATLIKRTFSFILICSFVLAAKWSYENYSTNEDLRKFILILSKSALWLISCILIIVIGHILFGLFYGDYDQWFETHTDPIIKKVQDFFNRRNNGL